MFPGVVEYDSPGDYVEMRAQVYGATVQSYSWNTSQASRAACVTGTSSYKLQFRWGNNSATETTETITLTVTMTDSSTLQQSLTFKLAPGQAACSSGGGYPSLSYPPKFCPRNVNK